MLEERKVRGLLALLLILHFLLGALYSVIVPPWEVHDETGHYPYVRYVATHWTLPPIGSEISQWYDEAHQPPLYYILGALATFWVDTGDYSPPAINYHALDGTGRGGYNITVHNRPEGFPYRGAMLALHLARLVSVALSTIVVWATYLLARTSFRKRLDLALGAAAVNAFMPQFLFLGSGVTNDVLTSLTFSLVLLGLLKALVEGPETRWLALLGLSLGLGFLTKNSALSLVPLVALGVGLAAWRWKRSWLAWARWELTTFGLAALLSGWWYGRNLLLYGRLIPDRAEENPIVSTIAPIFKAARQISYPTWVWALAGNAFRSFWGLFGWGNVPITDRWVYWILALLSLTSAAGLALLGWRLIRSSSGELKGARPSLLILALAVLFTAALPLYRAIYFREAYLLPGRYLLPAVSALSLLFVLGLAELMPERWRRVGLGSLGLGLLALAIVTPLRYIAPAYARPRLISEADIRPEGPVYVNFGDKLELLGYDLDNERLLPGEELEVALYWRTLTRMEEDYTIGVHILGRDLQSWGQTNTHPGHGNFPTSLWKPGDIIRDTYRVRLSPHTPVPALGRISVGVQLYPRPDSLATFDDKGQPITPIFGRLKLASPYPREYEIANRLHHNFDGQVALVGYELDGGSFGSGDRLLVALYWQGLAPGPEDLTIFLHLVDEKERIWAQADAQPWKGEYPTSLWDQGEMVMDTYELAIREGTPAGRYRLKVGLYTPSGKRLPVVDDEGRPQADYIYLPPILTSQGQE